MYKINRIKKIMLVSYLTIMHITVNAQPGTNIDRENRIAASQAGASPLFFNPMIETVPVIEPGRFYAENECTVRNGLQSFFSKLKTGKSVTIGYIGGSITQGNYCYRTQSARYIQSVYPSGTIKFLNAGVSGTGTDLGACRLEDQLLKHKPDLIFVEFAVNGAYRDGMEGIIRQVIKNDPSTDICLIYTIFTGQTTAYAEGRIPENIQGLETIAAHYNIPSVHLGMEAAQLEKENKLVWKGDTAKIKDKIVFSSDGIHPLAAGGNLYAASIARAFNKMKSISVASKHVLPAALLPGNWEDAKMYAPLEVTKFSNDWVRTDTRGPSTLKQFNGWFPYVMQAEKAGSSFQFKFKGNMFGFFDIGGPEAGQLSIEIDGKPVALKEISTKGFHLYKAMPANSEKTSPVLNRFNSFCNNRYRGQYDLIETEPGEHTVTVRISPDKADKSKILGEKQQADIRTNPAKYDRTVFYLGKILLRGEIIK